MTRRALLLCLLSIQSAAAFTPGNILVSEGNQLLEYTTGGQLVGTTPVQYPGGHPPSEQARDLVFDKLGNLRLFNGTYSPHMTTYEPGPGVWSHETYPQWDTDNNVSFGGIGVANDRVFVTDMTLDVAPTASGVVAFDSGAGTSERFAANLNPTDLTVGLDGLLYVLNPDGMYFQNGLVAYDPATLAHVRDIDIALGTGVEANVRAVAVDGNGDIYIADWNGIVHHMDKDARLLRSVTIICDDIFPIPIGCSLTDIDINNNGIIVLGDRYGHVFLTNRLLAQPSRFLTNFGSAFVALIPESVRDSDGDGVADNSDNCIELANPDQRDSNADGFGNVCDPDLTNDGVVDFMDLDVMKQVFLTTDADADFNGDMVVNFADLAVMRAFFLGPPGP